MKNLIFTILINLLLGQYLFCQTNGKITYTETFKIDIQVEGLDDEMLNMIPQSQSLSKELLFNSSTSVFKTKKGESIDDVNMSSDDGSFQLTIMMDDEVENILYKDFKSKTITHQKGIMGKPFLVTDKLNKIKWKISNEKVMYLGYECQKATLETDEEFVIAWFTSQLPVQIGPDVYHGLPGAILMLSIDDGETEYKASSIDLESSNDLELSPPTKGKKVSQEEFVKIEKEKEAEMMKMYSKEETRSIGH